MSESKFISNSIHGHMQLEIFPGVEDHSHVNITLVVSSNPYRNIGYINDFCYTHIWSRIAQLTRNLRFLTIMKNLLYD